MRGMATRATALAAVPLLLLLLLPPLHGAAASRQFALENLSRRGGLPVHVGDLVEVTCVDCGVVSDFSAPAGGVRFVRRTGDESGVVEVLQDGAVAVQALHDDNRTSLLLLDVVRSSVFCYEWRTCFTTEKLGPAACLASWSDYTAPAARLYLRIWASPVAAEHYPVNHSSLVSEEELLLTDELQSLGEEPMVHLDRQVFRDRSQPVVSIVSEVDYLRGERMWVVALSSSFAEMPQVYFPGGMTSVEIRGQHVSVMGCTTGTGVAWFELTKFAITPAESATGRVPLDSSIEYDACASVLSIRGSDKGSVWLSEAIIPDADRVAEHVSQPLDLFQALPASTAIVDMANTREGMLFLGEQNLALLQGVTSHPWAASGRATSLGAKPAGATRIRTSAGCDWLLTHESKSRNDIVVAWDGDSQDVDKVHLSLDGGMSFAVVRLATPQLAAGYRVIQAEPLGSAAQIAVLLANEARDEQEVLFLSEMSGQVLARSLFGVDGALPALGARPRLFAPVAPSGELYLAGGAALHYSMSTGRSWRTMAFRSFSADSRAYEPSEWAATETIVHVATSFKRDLAVLSSEGRLFWTKQGLLALYEAYSPVSAAQAAITRLLYRPDGRLFVVRAQEDTPRALRVAPVLLEKRVLGGDAAALDAAQVVALSKARLGPTECPFLDWSSKEGELDSFYADMKDTITATMQLTHVTTKEDFRISFQTSNRDLLEMRPRPESVVSNQDGSILRRERILELLAPNGRGPLAEGATERPEPVTGKVVVRASPTQTALGCSKGSSMLQINVGCPRGRHVRHQAPAARVQPSKSIVSAKCESEASGLSGTEYNDRILKCTCETYRDLTVSLPKERVNLERAAQYLGSSVQGLNDDSAESIEFPFDYEKYGCPTFVPYTEQYLPQLEIWDGDEFVKKVDADFTVFEATGRNDFTFGVSALDAGCVRRPDNWADKLAASDNDNYTLAWGPHNHRGCHNGGNSTATAANASHATEDWASMQYEILNMRGSNYITFNKVSEPMPFHFFAVVVDPDYSYCTLQTSFALEPYGMPIDTLTTFFIVFYVVLASLVLLACTYQVHRRDILAAAAAERVKKKA